MVDSAPVVYMARDVTILMRANLFQGPLEELGSANEILLDPKMATEEARAMWAQKSRDLLGSPLSMARVMDLPASKSSSPRVSFCILCSVFYILYCMF